MADELKVKTNLLLANLSKELDISPAQFAAAVERYQAVGKWLGEADSDIVQYEPDIYPQGSFMLGTVIKPFNDEDHYDIDLVCELKNISVGSFSQKELKDLVGDRLKKHGVYRKLIEDRKPRCWTLTYSEGTSFHMDILPAVSDSQKNFLTKEAGTLPAIPPIWIADEKMQEWKATNPKGYSAWFKNRTEALFALEMRKIAMFREAKIEDVPLNRIKTPLQRTIQILKRHRDFVFQEDQKGKPISIIIATLAASYYEGESDIIDILQKVVPKMLNYVQNRQVKPYIPNPACDDEDFGEKWLETKLRENFISWLERFQEDFREALRQSEIGNVALFLERRLGENMVKAAFAESFESKSVNITPPLVEIKRRSSQWRR